MLKCDGILVWLGATAAVASVDRAAIVGVLMQIRAYIGRGS